MKKPYVKPQLINLEPKQKGTLQTMEGLGPSDKVQQTHLFMTQISSWLRHGRRGTVNSNNKHWPHYIGNPISKISGKMDTLNFSWHYASTPANKQRGPS